jgi:glycosyltransferase involved in cell wall biosynthesis
MKSDTPLVSVLMPVYNAEKFLSIAIESILTQTFVNFELMIINDGSTDSSEKIILSYRDIRIKYLINSENRGLIHSLNLGISNSRGKYLARIDADDIAHSHRLEKQVAFMESHSDYGMCGTLYQVIDPYGKVLNDVNLPLSEVDTKTSINFSNCFCHSTMMIRTALAEQLKYQKEYYLIEDYELWYNISRVSKICNLPIHSTYYRIHGSNISIEKKEQMLDQLHKMNARILQDLNIEFTNEQLKLHTNLLAYNYAYFQNAASIGPAEFWILKVYHHLKNNSAFNNRIIANLFINRWLAICFNTKRYRSIFSWKLLINFRWEYLKCLTGKLTRPENWSSSLN